MIPPNRQIIQYMLKHIQEIANIATDFLSWLQVSELKTRAPPYRQRTDNSSSFLSMDLSKTADLLLRSSLSKFTTSAYKSEYWMYNQFSTPFFTAPTTSFGFYCSLLFSEISCFYRIHFGIGFKFHCSAKLFCRYGTTFH